MSQDISFDGCSYSVSNIYTSAENCIDRLDISKPGTEKTAFVRALRIVNSASDVTVIVNGLEADELVYSLALIRKDGDDQSFHARVDKYLMNAMLTEIFLVSNQKDEANVSSRFKEIPKVFH